MSEFPNLQYGLIQEEDLKISEPHRDIDLEYLYGERREVGKECYVDQPETVSRFEK